MIYKRHCILDLAQCARASTCPDTLLDACERPRANLDSTIALACSSLPATIHTCIVLSSSARSCRYAICAQRCACERERPLLASSLSCAHAAEQARHRKQALGQRRPPLRPPHSRSEARDDAAPAQRTRGRTLDCTAPTPRQLHMRPAATTLEVDTHKTASLPTLQRPSPSFAKQVGMATGVAPASRRRPGCVEPEHAGCGTQKLAR